MTGLSFVVVSVKCLLLTLLYSAWLFWNVFRFSSYSICKSILDRSFFNFITLVFAIVNFFWSFALRVHFAFNQNIGHILQTRILYLNYHLQNYSWLHLECFCSERYYEMFVPVDQITKPTLSCEDHLWDTVSL